MDDCRSLRHLSFDMHFAPHRAITLISANDNPRSERSDRRTATADGAGQRPGSVTIQEAIGHLISGTADGSGPAAASNGVAVWSGKLPLRVMAAARRDLREIHRYTVETYSGDRGHAYLRELESSLDLLAAYPSLGRAVDEHMRRFVRGKHIVLYRIVVGVIVIDRVFHGAQRR